MKIIKQSSFILAALLLTACAAKNIAEEPAKLNDFAAEARIKHEWSASTGKMAQHAAIKLLPYFDEDTFYTVASGGQISQFDTQTGKSLWKKKTTDIISAGITGSSDKLFYGTKNGDLVAVNKSDAKELWRVPLKAEILASPLPMLGLVIARTLDGNIQAFASNSGEKRWSYKMSVPSLTLHGNSRPISIGGQALLVGGDNGRMVALEPSNGRILLESALAAGRGANAIQSLVDIDMTPSYDGQLLYISAYQNGIYAISLKNGSVVWRKKQSTYHPVSYDDNNIYFTDTDSQVWALNRLTGEVVWMQKGLRARKVSGPIMHDNKVVVSDYQGIIHVLSSSDGRFIARKSVGKSGYLSQVSASDTDNTFYYTKKNGQFSAYKIAVNKTDSK